MTIINWEQRRTRPRPKKMEEMQTVLERLSCIKVIDCAKIAGENLTLAGVIAIFISETPVNLRCVMLLLAWLRPVVQQYLVDDVHKRPQYRGPGWFGAGIGCRLRVVKCFCDRKA